MPSTLSAEDHQFLNRAVEASVRIAVLGLLLIWCFQIARPFVQPIVWGVIIAIASHPAYVRLGRALGGRERLAAGMLVVGALLLLIVPSVLLSTSLISSATELASELHEHKINIPPPPASVATWPIIGDEVYGIWSTASRSLEAALGPLTPQLKVVGQWILATGATAGFGLVVFAIAIAIAGVLLSSGDRASEAARGVARRLLLERGDEFVDLARATVQSVTRGILGVALIQAVMSGIGLLIVGVPAAGLWALLVLLMAVVQLPTALLLLPIVIYVFSTSPTWVAILFAIWAVIISLSDNVLKPILLGRGVDVPMLVIFIGAIGGFMLQGIIGLFVGAVVLSVGYTLFRAWVQEVPAAGGPVGIPEAVQSGGD
jgi:predicted PurR-regulated permease PerM